jgi:hypothetical protein
MFETCTCIGLTDQQRKYIRIKHSKLPAFHVIAKIHKNPIKGRPIVGAVDWVTTPFSTLLGIKLQAILPSMAPTILKDSTDLVSKWGYQPFNTTNDWLVSLDVTSLYTNIIVNDAIEIISKIDPNLGKLASYIMRNNYFEYNNYLFHQKEGIAMGTNCAVALANLYMYSLIDVRLVNVPGIRLYGRYIDDICFVYEGPIEDLLEIIVITNTYHDKLQFTHVISKTELDVLDITFYPKNGKLEFKTFQKIMNKYLYIPYFSYHPPATLGGFIKGELIRYSRSNSEFHNEFAIRKLFYKRLADRGYPHSYLNTIFRLSSSTRLQIPRTIDPEVEAIQVLPYIKSTRIMKLKTFLTSCDILPDPFLRVIPVWSTTPSLGRLLLQSKLSPEQSSFLASKGFH